MARTPIAVQTPPAQYPVLPLTALGAQLLFTAADIANFNSAPMTGRELLIVQSKDAGAQTVTINSFPDTQRRSGDITAYSIPIGSGSNTFAIFGPFPTAGWMQADGNLYFQGSTANIFFAWVRIPPVS